MRSLRILALAAAASLASAAETGCPWMNAATAGGVLGGGATETVTKKHDDADCDFARDGKKLSIEVKTMGDPAKEFPAYLTRCGKRANPLRAIGNEAVACNVKDAAGAPAGLVVGRVRPRAFVVRVRGGGLSQAELNGKAWVVAEQVAGNLF